MEPAVFKAAHVHIAAGGDAGDASGAGIRRGTHIQRIGQHERVAGEALRCLGNGEVIGGDVAALAAVVDAVPAVCRAHHTYGCAAVKRGDDGAVGVRLAAHAHAGADDKTHREYGRARLGQCLGEQL